MPVYHDHATGFLLGSPDTVPLSTRLPSPTDIESALKPLILSASGWRKVFAVSGDEEDTKPEIGDANRVLVAHMAAVFADYLGARHPNIREVALGYDTRPTGPALADVMLRVFIARGYSVLFTGTVAAPEIMAYTRTRAAFAYISASHNPIGHNGVKFGIDNGGVLDGSEASALIAMYRTAIMDAHAASNAQQEIRACQACDLELTMNKMQDRKRDALAAYSDFTRLVVSDEEDEAACTAFFGSIRESASKLSSRGTPLSVIADFNGSARCASIDRDFMEAGGISFRAMNDRAGRIAHRIVPEGSSLDFCAREIERLRREGSTAEEKNTLLGYVPDCDGDRGNIVFWNEAEGRATQLEAQEVFALSVVAELAHLAYRDPERVAKASISINDPTSLRIEAIARAFGATVERAEVGEANVVNLARELRARGRVVRILGEGSNGGNITHPAAVRDPINTVYALLKLLVIRDRDGIPGLFHIWCSRSGQEERYRDDFTLADILSTLPPFVTTSVFEKEAMLGIRTTDHDTLKRSFQSVFEREWVTASDRLRAERGIHSWLAISNNGTVETRNLADFGLSGKGGLKIQFLDSDGEPIAFIWMRGSGTEPVFRILADAKGSDRSFERELLAWLTRMVLEADTKIL